MGSLDGVEAIHVATVLEDCVDQLAILGRIMPTSFESRPEKDEIVSDDINQLVEDQKGLESRYQDAVGARKDLKGQGHTVNGQRTEATKTIQGVGGELRNSTHVFARSLKQSALTPDVMEKVQADRGFLERILYGTLLEMSQRGSFQTLMDAVRTEKEKKARLQETILKEEAGRKRLKLLQRQLQDVKKEKEAELQQRSEMIAHLKDQLQEMKAKTNMEGKYIKKSADVAVAQTQKRCTMEEKQMKDDTESYRNQIEEEKKVNMEVESYLRTHVSDMQVKLDTWMNKYDTDVDAKQKELDLLKMTKAKDLERLQELTKLYHEYEQVVVEDRIEKEKARRKAEQEAEELSAATMLQSWWRGVMVRQAIGPYGKKKKKKGKKGKKSGKKKKK